MRVLRMLLLHGVGRYRDGAPLSNQFLFGCTLFFQALPLLRAQGTGRIINVSSVVAHKPSFEAPVATQPRKVHLKVTRAVLPSMLPTRVLLRIQLPMVTWRQGCCICTRGHARAD